jgi:hypothetical protein
VQIHALLLFSVAQVIRSLSHSLIKVALSISISPQLSDPFLIHHFNVQHQPATTSSATQDRSAITIQQRLLLSRLANASDNTELSPLRFSSSHLNRKAAASTTAYATHERSTRYTVAKFESRDKTKRVRPGIDSASHEVESGSVEPYSFRVLRLIVAPRPLQNWSSNGLAHRHMRSRPPARYS